MQPMMGAPGMAPMMAPSMMQMPGVGMGMPTQPNYQLPAGYELPRLSYTADRKWGGWDLASRHYSGTRLERSWLDSLMSRVGEFMGSRQLSEAAAYESFLRVYNRDDGADAGNRTLGGAAAYQAYLLWTRDHWAIFSQNSHDSNLTLITSMAVAELYRLWDVVSPRSSRAKLITASEYAAATARYLYERHFMQPGLGGGELVPGLRTLHHRPSFFERRRRHRSSSCSSSSDSHGGSRRPSHLYDDYAVAPSVMQPGMGGMGPIGAPMYPGMAMQYPGMAQQYPGMAQQYPYQQPYAAGYAGYAPGYAGQQAYLPQTGAGAYYPAFAGQSYYPGAMDPNMQVSMAAASK
ncbi:hypothetical protein CspeluHIS016_0802540 [Cutaneotrichosporon spelunceum]|uniref:Uncharacterized protein n=1 Tax=Cutaneotrichosporon spelunceum TaxID=1672016 RepID=A0AAD3YEZ6_9TREE|nr:hypothetical protein CspeluHIS016_0802540 [Cutaneotrichosporon spelunceum]